MIITIVTPSYNQGDYIEDTIKSIIYQKGTFELEYIIIDGGSKDQTIDIIKKYDKLIKSKKFRPRCKKLFFRWVSEKDNGQSHAINKGFKIARGDIINWICSDDLLEDNSLETVHNFFNENKNAKVMFGNSKMINEKNQVYNFQRGREFTREELIRRWDKAYNLFYIPQPSTFLRKEILNEVGYLNESVHLCMDYEWYLKINKKYKFYYINKTFSSSRFHRNCKSVRLESESYKASMNMAKQYIKEIGYAKILNYYYKYLFINIDRIFLTSFKRKFPRIYNFAKSIINLKDKESQIKVSIFILISISWFILYLQSKYYGLANFYWIFSLIVGFLILAIIELYFRVQHNIDLKIKELSLKMETIKNKKTHKT